MSRTAAYAIIIACGAALLSVVLYSLNKKDDRPDSLAYDFNVPGILFEADSIGDSTSPYWWVNSGAKLIVQNGFGETIQGALDSNDPWRILYDKNNPTDTDQGMHPQNIFRLILKSTWQKASESAYFRIAADNFSKSPNRNESNGLLLFTRYMDSQNLYYAGIRVDGTAVIKKKINGAYYTLAQEKIFPGDYEIARDVNLLPHDVWIGLKLDSKNLPDGSLVLTLWDDVNAAGAWTKLLIATDTPGTYGNHVFTAAGHGGIRTDFMDVQFKDYLISSSL